MVWIDGTAVHIPRFGVMGIGKNDVGAASHNRKRFGGSS
jgi:hypothetical protein